VASTPKYLNVADDLQQAMASGELRPGDRLLSEPELAAQHGVSRETVRRALEVLERDGRVQRVQGSGTYVAPPASGHFSLTTFAESMVRLGRTPSAELLEAIDLPASVTVAKRLAIREGTGCFRVRRRLIADGDPVAGEVRILPVSLCPKLLDHDLAQPSLHWLFTQTLQIPMVKVDHTVELGHVGPEWARTLDVPPEESAYLIDRLTYTTGPGGPVPAVWYRSVHRGAAYSIEFRKDTA
jgi:GntR family transcriptional regulator